MAKMSYVVKRLSEMPDEIDHAIGKKRSNLRNSYIRRLLAVVFSAWTDASAEQKKELHDSIDLLVMELMTRTASIERSGPHARRERARDLGRKGGRVRSQQSMQRKILKLAGDKWAVNPKLSRNRVSEEIAKEIPGVTQPTARRYLTGVDIPETIANSNIKQ